MSTSDLDVTLKFMDWQELYSREKPFQIFIDIPDDADDQRSSNLVFKNVQVPLKDVRTVPDNFSLDANGFIFRKYKTNVSDISNRETVETAYLPEIENILREEIAGVDRIYIFDWRVSSIPFVCSSRCNDKQRCSAERTPPELRALFLI